MFQSIRETVQAYRESREKIRRVRLRKEAIEAGLIEPTVRTGPTFSTGIRNDNRGNQYIDYGSQVGEGWKRWRNQAQYGNEIVRLIVRYRVGLICGNGAVFSGERKAEKDWAAAFLEANAFDGSLLQKIVTGTEFEGRALLYLQDSEVEFKGQMVPMVAIKYMPWEKWKYTLETDPDDGDRVIRVRFKDGRKETVVLEEGEFVYFVTDDSGDVHRPNSTIGSILTPAVNMGKALADWRSMNHLWGSMGAYFEAADIATAQAMISALDAKQEDGGWEVGDVLAGPAKMYFPEPSGRGQESIEREIDASARIISGATGVPIHQMGWAREMSNRATAEELTDSSTAHTQPQREVLTEALHEVVRKALMRFPTGADYSRITVELAPVTRQQVKDLVDVYVPLADGGYISKADVQARIPGIDPTKTNKQLEKEKEESVALQQTMGMTPNEPQEDEEDAA